MRSLLGAGVAALAFAAAPAGVKATEVLFTITGPDPTVTFELPLSPTPDFYSPNFFGFNSVSVDLGGTTTPSAILFYPTDNSGGLRIFTYDQWFDADQTQLYTGPESNPTFVLGAYPGMVSYDTNNVDTVTLTAVLEPSTWAMMLIGFAGLGLAGYRWRREAALGA